MKENLVAPQSTRASTRCILARESPKVREHGNRRWLPSSCDSSKTILLSAKVEILRGDKGDEDKTIVEILPKAGPPGRSRHSLFPTSHRRDARQPRRPCRWLQCGGCDCGCGFGDQLWRGGQRHEGGRRERFRRFGVSARSGASSREPCG